MRFTVLHMAFATGWDFLGEGAGSTDPKEQYAGFYRQNARKARPFRAFFVKTTYGVCALKDMLTAANAGNQAYALFFRSCRYGLFLGGDFAFGFVIDRVLFGAFLSFFLGFRRLRSDIIRIKRGSD